MVCIYGGIRGVGEWVGKTKYTFASFYNIHLRDTFVFNSSIRARYPTPTNSHTSFKISRRRCLTSHMK